MNQSFEGEYAAHVYIGINGAQRELTVRSIQGKSYREGDILTLKNYKEGIYYID